jgi:hypothetical protein
VISPEKRKVLDLFAEGRRLYRQKKFAEACNAFKRALAIDSEDGPSQVYVGRCQDLIAEPPAENWDGVFTVKHKDE